jgi:glycosyltransferase involved in cell wall biosynthesis
LTLHNSKRIVCLHGALFFIMKISLCIIVGNVENIIGRFLDHFQPLADEIIAVRAIGNQEPDKTLEICKQRGVETAEYFNKSKNKWPHCDDFAAARNLSCEMASHEWVMWADTDDVISTESIERIKFFLSEIQSKDIDAVLMPYVVPEDGVINMRERIWRKGAGQWVYPIHECYKLNNGHKAVILEDAEIVHASEPRHSSRDERNLRIIESISEDERTISQKFHFMQSLVALERKDEATMAAINFVRDDEAGKNEKYEAFFQLAQLSDDIQTRLTMLTQALVTDPNRREAYGELALAFLTVEPENAMGLTQAMLALELPKNPPWNLRRPYYGSLGVSLRGMALRANGAIPEADELELNHFQKHGKKISLLHATRGRPEKAWKCRKEWLRRAKNPDAIEHIFAIDHDDEASLPLMLANHVIVTSAGCVAAWNAAASKSRGDVLVQVSDDFEPPMGWDESILAELGDLSESKVLAVSDGNRKDDLLCMSILTRKRYEEQGYMYHPDFFSMYSDNYFSVKAFEDGVVIDARERLVFNHNHPLFGKGQWDETYIRSNSDENYAKGKAIFEKLMTAEK